MLRWATDGGNKTTEALSVKTTAPSEATHFSAAKHKFYCPTHTSIQVTVLALPACIQVHGVPHDTGVIGQNDEGPHVPCWTPSLQTPTTLQLQVMIRKLFDQEVCSTYRRKRWSCLGDGLWKFRLMMIIFALCVSHKPIPAPLKTVGSTSMMWLGQYFLYTAISYSLTTRMCRCDAPSMAWYRLNRPCSWRPVVGVKIGLLMQSGLYEKQVVEDWAVEMMAMTTIFDDNN